MRCDLAARCPPFDRDVAVVGAGPAGASTAAHLSRTGLRVWLLDQKRFPRDKVCGDLVGPVALFANPQPHRRSGCLLSLHNVCGQLS